MAVRWTSSGGAFSSTEGVGSLSSYTITCYVMIETDRNAFGNIIWMESSNRHYFINSDDGITTWFQSPAGVQGNQVWSLNTWYRLAIVVSSTTVTLYRAPVGSALEVASGSVTAASSQNNIYLGGSSINSDWFSGRMAAFKMWNAALSAAEVEQELFQYQPVRTASLLRFHPFITADGTDYSGNGYDLSGGAGALTADGPPIKWKRPRGSRLGAGSSELLFTGIPSAEAWGDMSVTPGDVDISSAGIPSGEAWGTATLKPAITLAGIPSEEAWGTAFVELTGTIGLTLYGIPSEEAFGTLALSPGPISVTTTGIASAEAWGTPSVQLSATLVGIASGEVFGSLTLAPGPVGVTLNGIASAEAWGIPLLRITISTIATVAPQRRNTPIYELLVMGRVPRQSGAPGFFLIDPIDWSTLSYSDTLSRPQTLSATCKIASVTELVAQRLRSPDTLPTELWLQRNGKTVFAGPLLGGLESSDELTLEAGGLLTYLQWMYVTSDLRYTQADQFAIVSGLVDHWQNLEFGNFGIQTASAGASGVLRDAVYERKEIHQISRRVEELGAAAQGFDIEIDPTTRNLELWYPGKGIDRSTGPNAIVFDGRSIEGLGGMFSVTPNDLASDAFGTGSAAGVEETYWSEQANTTLRAVFGRTGIGSSFSEVPTQGALDDFVAGLRDSRGIPLRAPGKQARVTPDTDLNDYEVGDTISYQLSGILGIGGAFRIRSRQVSVSETGQEAVTLEFV